MALLGRTFTPVARLGLGGVLIAGILLFAAVSAKMLAYPHEVVVSEGAVGLAIDSIREGVPLYDPVRVTSPPFVVVHYTPVYYLLAALVATLVGPGFLAGRLVSVLFTVGTAVVAGIFVRRETGRLLPAFLSVALWLSFYQVVFWGTSQRVDAPGIFFEAVGLAVYASAREKGRGGLAALPWLVLAWATKQVMVVGLLAVTLDRWLDSRREGLRVLLLGWAPILLLFSGLTLYSRGGFWTATVLGTVSSHADTPWVVLSNAELFFGSPWNVLCLLLAAAAAALRPGSRFLGLYLGIGMVVAIATDANLPRFFPPLLAMALLIPRLLDATRRLRRLHAFVLGSMVLAGASHLAYEMRPLVRERVLDLHEGNERLRFADAVRRHTTPEGQILAQDVGMLLSAGRRVILADPLVFSILTGNGAFHPSTFVEGIRARRYEALVLNRRAEALDPHEWTTLWIAPAKEAILANYVLAETITIGREWRFLEPTRYIYVRRPLPE